MNRHNRRFIRHEGKTYDFQKSIYSYLPIWVIFASVDYDTSASVLTNFVRKTSIFTHRRYTCFFAIVFSAEYSDFQS